MQQTSIRVPFDVACIYGFVGWGSASKVDDVTALPCRADDVTASHIKMADMRYYGNFMTTTRWRLYVTMETLWQQKYITSSVYDYTVEDVEYIYNKFSL